MHISSIYYLKLNNILFIIYLCKLLNYNNINFKFQIIFKHVGKKYFNIISKHNLNNMLLICT